MGENTFRYSPGAPGVQTAGGGRGDRKKRAAGSDGRGAGGLDGRGTGPDGVGAGGLDGRGTNPNSRGRSGLHGRRMSGSDTQAVGQSTVALLAGGQDDNRTDSNRTDSNRAGGNRAGGNRAGSNRAGSKAVGGSETAGLSEAGEVEHGASDVTGAAAAAQTEPSAKYWRRRFIILAVGLTVLAAASWGLSRALRIHPAARSSTGALRTSGNTAAPPAGSPAATAGQHGTGGGQGGHGSGGSGKSGTRTVTRQSPAPKPTVTTSGFAGFKPAFCSWHSIVLSLSASQVHFGSRQQPAFSLSVVSTQPTNCSFNVGPGHLAVVIKEGPARIWSSADCASGTGSLVTALRRGVPTVVAIDWNRRMSSPGCGGPARAVPPGSYTAYATEGSIVSAPVTVRLG